MDLTSIVQLAEESYGPTNMLKAGINGLDLGMVEAYIEFSETNVALDKALTQHQELLDAYAEVIRTDDFIAEEGVSDILLKFIDKDQTVFPASVFDEVTAMPAQNTEVSIKIKDIGKTIWNAIKAFFKKIKEMIMKMFSAAERFFFNASKALDAILKKLDGKKQSDLKTEKFDKAKTKSYKGNADGLLLNEMSINEADVLKTSVDQLKDMAKDIKDFEKKPLGEVKYKLTALVAKNKKIASFITSTAKNIGFETTETLVTAEGSTYISAVKMTKNPYDEKEEVDLKKAISGVETYYKYTESFNKIYKKSNDKYKDVKKKLASVTDDLVKSVDKIKTDDDKEIKQIRHALNQIKAASNIVSYWSGIFVKIQTEHAFMLVTAGKKLVGCLKAKDDDD